MPNLRALLVALTILAMMIAPVLVTSIGLGTPSSLSAFAAPTMQDDDDGNDDEDGNGDGDDGNNDGVDGDDDDGVNVNNDDDNNDDNNNDDDNDDDGGNDDNDDGGDDDGGDDNDNDGNNDDNGDDDGGDDDGGDDDGGGGDDEDDDGGDASPFVPGYTPPARQAQSDCSTPGQQLGFNSSDGKVSVTVYSNMPQGVRIRIRKPIDAGAVPAVPGQQVDALLFEVAAETCDGGPLARLPVEVNLGVRYTDGDVGGLNEANFKIARVDAGAWKAVDKQAPDAGANYVSATITDLGYFVVHVP